MELSFFSYSSNHHYVSSSLPSAPIVEKRRIVCASTARPMMPVAESTSLVCTFIVAHCRAVHVWIVRLQLVDALNGDGGSPAGTFYVSSTVKVLITRIQLDLF